MGICEGTSGEIQKSISKFGKKVNIWKIQKNGLKLRYAFKEKSIKIIITSIIQTMDIKWFIS